MLDLVPSRIRSRAFLGLDLLAVDTRYKEHIFILPFIFATIKKFWIRNSRDFSVHYLSSVVRLSRAKNVVGFSPLNRQHQQVALENDHVLFHFFQSGLQSTTSERSSEVAGNRAFSARNVTNYIFGCSHQLSQLSQQASVNWGSLLNNLWMEENENITLVERVIFISQWRPFVDRPEKPSDTRFGLALIDAFKQTLLWSESRNIELVILGNPKSAGFAPAEKEFYSQMTAGQIQMIEPKNVRESYEACRESKFISTLNSALGFEMLGCGKQVAFWGLDENQLPILEGSTLENFFREIGLDLSSSCDLGLQLDYYINTKASRLAVNATIKKIMSVQTRASQEGALRKIFS